MRILLRAFLLLCALFLASLLSTNPVYAFENKVMGDVIVGEDERVEEVSTAWGDVLVVGEVEEDVKSGFGNIRIEGPVGGDVEAEFGDVRIDAPVEGDVEAEFGDLELGRGARIAGKVHVGNGSIENDPEAEVWGPQVTGMADVDEDSPLGAFSDAIGWIMMTLGLVAVAVLLAVAVPRPLKAAAWSLEVSLGRSIVLGLGSFPAMIMLSILLVVTVVGSLLLPLLWPAYAALVLFGLFVTAYFLGRKVVLATGRYRAGDAVAAAVGAVLIAAAYQIPFFGGLVFAVLALSGAGAAIFTLIARRSWGTPPVTYASYEDYLRDRRDA